MELPVIIEPLAERTGFSARLTAPLQLSAEGETAEEAHRRLAILLQSRLEEGLEFRSLHIPSRAAQGGEAGWLPDDELTREWLGQVQAYRADCDAADHERLGTGSASPAKPS